MYSFFSFILTHICLFVNHVLRIIIFLAGKACVVAVNVRAYARTSIVIARPLSPRVGAGSCSPQLYTSRHRDSAAIDSNGPIYIH